MSDAAPKGAPSDTAHLPAGQRERMTALYRRVLPAARRAFVQDGEAFLFGIPPWVVRAWVIAAVTGADTVCACIDAHLGEGAFAKFRDKPGWDALPLGRAQARRLAELDRLTLKEAA